MLVRRVGSLALAVLAVFASRAEAATKTWNGSVGPNWTANGNWSPMGMPSTGDDLVFPADTMATPVFSFTSTNDFPSGTSFGSTTIASTGYDIGGNPVSLVQVSATYGAGPASAWAIPTTFSGGQIAVSDPAATFVFGGTVAALPIFTTALNVAGTLTISGPVQDATHLDKNGVGTARFQGTGSGGPVLVVHAGKAVIATDAALGSTGMVTVEPGATLELAGGVTTPVSLHLAGTGTSGQGALVGTGLGANTTQGSIALDASTTIGCTPAVVPSTLTLAGVISGSPGSALTFTTNANGTIVLSGNNTYLGSTSIDGTVALANGNGLGQPSTGPATIGANGELRFAPSGAGITVGENVTTASSSSKLTSVNGNNTFSGTLQPTTPTTITVLSGQLSFSGGLNGGGGRLDKDGGGTLVLNGNDSLSLMFVHSGTLLVNGSDPTANAAAQMTGTFGGNGSVGSIGASDTGVVSPGTSPGILTTGTFSLPSGTILHVELNGTGLGEFDQLIAASTVVLGGTLEVVPGFPYQPGATFLILRKDSAGAITGTFNGLAQGAMFTAAGQQFSISYAGGNGNDVVLTFVGCVSDTQGPTVSPPLIPATVTQTVCS